jgi:DNA invertase Pin-like site-specific DNA recombinase
MESLGRKAMQGITIENGGNPVGRPAGTTLETKKAEESKQKILRLSADFDGYMHDQELIKYLGISRNSFYKYKSELKRQHNLSTKLNFNI